MELLVACLLVALASSLAVLIAGTLLATYRGVRERRRVPRSAGEPGEPYGV